MRFPAPLLPALLLGLCLSSFPQSVPPGAPAPRSMNPSPGLIVPAGATVPAASSTRPDPQELQREAKQISELSQSIQLDVESIVHGLLPKDTVEKLKRIEKLSKNLRSQLNR